jgi:ABC-type nitrate/sulfonate/bicarbonate transport system substrate-binding protein
MKAFRAAWQLLGIVCIGAALTVAALGSTVSYAQSQRVTIRYGYLPVPVMPLFSAQAAGLIEKAGIDLQLIKFTSGPATFQALQSGSIDLAQGAMPAYFMGTTRGLNARWVYSYGDYGPLEGLVVPSGSSVKEFKDLKGHKVALPPGTILQLGHLYSLREASMQPDDVQVVPLQPPQALAALLKKDVDAAWLWDPFISNAVEKGGRVIVTNKSLGLPDPFGLAANSKWLQDPKNVEALGRLFRTFDEGQRLYAKDKEPVLAEIKSVTGVDRETSLKLINGTDWYSVADQLSPNSPASMADPTNQSTGAGALLHKVEETALWGKMIEKRGNISEFLDNRPAKAAQPK